MKIYVNQNAGREGNGSESMPFRFISDAAKIAQPGDEVLVYPGIYREYVDPKNAGTEDARITYRSIEPLKAVISGAELLTGWEKTADNVWTARVSNRIFGAYNPYTTLVYGDWYFATPDKHTGAVYLNGQMLYEAVTLEECIAGEVWPYSWRPEESKLKWYAEQDYDRDETVFYCNFQGADPNRETVEINVRRECFMPSVTGISYITVSGFTVTMAATTWAPPAAFQDCMIGPHWSKGWIIEDCDISNSKCSGIGLGKYYDPENDHYFTYKYVKSPTQMERDAVCRGQYHGWVKEKVGSHIIRRNNIHHCEQGGIIGRMGGVFSIIEDNHIHHINNMMQLGGAEISGIKMHAAIDVIMRRNHIHDCTMGIWCDWEAQGTRISQNLLYNNQRPEFAQSLPGGMISQDIFVEVGHGPTLIDNNVLLSDASLRIATEGVAMVHNLICGAFTAVGGGTGTRYTPYHMRHRTEVMGFMTILHGDNRFYNNIFVQKWPTEDFDPQGSSDGPDAHNRKVGTHVWNGYPTEAEWLQPFIFDGFPDMRGLEPYQMAHRPVWISGNAYFNGAGVYEKEFNAFVPDCGHVKIDLVEKDGKLYLDSDLFKNLSSVKGAMIDTETLGQAFEPEQYFENPDGTPITFDRDYFGNHRGINVIPGPFATVEDAGKALL